MAMQAREAQAAERMMEMERHKREVVEKKIKEMDQQNQELQGLGDDAETQLERMRQKLEAQTAEKENETTFLVTTAPSLP